MVGKHTVEDTTPLLADGLVAPSLKASVSTGAGRRVTAATRHVLDGADPVTSFASALESLSGTDAWFSPHAWRGDQRAADRWESAAAIVTDLDYHDDRGDHKAPPSDVREKLEATARVGQITGNLFYATPRGARVVYLLDEPLLDPRAYDRAYLGAVVLGVLDLERAGLLARQDERGRRFGGYFPDLGVRDRARFFFSPVATVDGITRDASVVVLRPEPCDAATLAQCASAFSDLTVDPAPETKLMGANASPKRHATDTQFADAVERYAEDNPTDWGPAGGTCPMCGHHGCFGRSGPNPARWACFSSNHEYDSGGCGTPGDGCWTGDVLDVRAYETGLAPAQVLRDEGYLDGGGATRDASVVRRDDEAQSRPTLPFLDLAAIAANGIPPIDWIVPGWVARRDLIVLAGRAGAGKSTLTVDLAVAIASGRSWCGIAPEERGPVIYCDEEAGEPEIARQFLRHGAADVKDLHVASCVGIRLSDPQSVEPLKQAIADLRPVLVVLDTATQLFRGVDENSATGVAECFQPLLKLRETCGCVFMLIHHLRKPPQQGRADLLDSVRGSTAFGTQPSVVWSLKPSMGGKAVNLATEKRRGGGAPSPLRVEYVESGDRIELRGLEAPAAKETALENVSHFLTEKLRDGEEARTAELVHAGVGKYSASTIKHALSDLVKAGTLVRPQQGAYKLAEDHGEE